MNANNTTAHLRGPKQEIKCQILAHVLEDILDAAEGDYPLSRPITTWAQLMWNSATMDWVFDNPTASIVITWPCYPMGRDNTRIHAFYDRAKRLYNEQWRIGTLGRTEEDPEERKNNDSSIALAQACKQKWQTIGRMSKRG